MGSARCCVSQPEEVIGSQHHKQLPSPYPESLSRLEPPPESLFQRAQPKFLPVLCSSTSLLPPPLPNCCRLPPANCQLTPFVTEVYSKTYNVLLCGTEVS